MVHRLFFIFAMGSFIGPACRPTLASAQENAIVLRGATLETVAKAGRIENGVIVIKDGKIVELGKEVEIPESAEVVDVEGKTIMPGLIDPYHAISLPGRAAPTTRTIVIRGRTITLSSTRGSTSTSFSRVADSFYPYDMNFRPLLRSGVTHANLVAAGYGQSALARLTPSQPENMLAEAKGMLYVTVSNNSTTLNVVRSGLTSSRLGSRLAQMLTRRRSPARSAGRPGSSPTGGRRGSGAASVRVSSPARSLWAEIASGKRPLIVNANNSAAILHLLAVLERHKRVKLALISSGANVHQTFEEIKRRKPLLILAPVIDNAPNTRDRICVPRQVHQAGLEFAFSLSLNKSDLNASQDAPLFPVAMMVKAGLPRQTALAALTARPAKILGLEKTHGTLEKGKLANLLIFKGDPLDPVSQLEQVLVEGKTVYENDMVLASTDVGIP